MPYVNPNILEEDWDSLGSWTDQDLNGGNSLISPAGQLELDLGSSTGVGRAQRSKIISNWGDGDYYVEVRFKGDEWDGTVATKQYGIDITTNGGLWDCRVKLGNNDGNTMRVWHSAGGGWVFVKSISWGNDWHTVVFFIHNSQTDVDIWIDKDPRVEAPDVVDAVCAANIGSAGRVEVTGWGTTDGDGQYHIDHLYIGTETGSFDHSLTATVGSFILTGIATVLTTTLTMAVTVGTFVLTGITNIFTRSINLLAAVGVFTLTGIAITFKRVLHMVATVGVFVLTGIKAILIKSSHKGYSAMDSKQQNYPVALDKDDVSKMNSGQQDYPGPMEDTRDI